MLVHLCTDRTCPHHSVGPRGPDRPEHADQARAFADSLSKKLVAKSRIQNASLLGLSSEELFRLETFLINVSTFNLIANTGTVLTARAVHRRAGQNLGLPMIGLSLNLTCFCSFRMSRPGLSLLGAHAVSGGPRAARARSSARVRYWRGVRSCLLYSVLCVLTDIMYSNFISCCVFGVHIRP